MTRVPLIVIAAAAASGQSILNAPDPTFDQPPAATFPCEVKPVPPALNFGLRFQARYAATFPLKLFPGSGHRLHVLLRVTPDDRPPSYLQDKIELPPVPETRASIVAFGSILVGEGNYRVGIRLEDEQHRVCRADWKMRARRNRAEESLTPVMAPGEVAALSSVVRAQAPRGTADAGRLTIFLHAAPLRSRNTILQPGDIQQLTGSLAALLERVPASSVRLVVFNLDQEKQVLRRDGFTLSEIDTVTKTLSDLQVGTVDYQVLSDPRRGAVMLSDMLSDELRYAGSADAVVLLGPEARTRVQVRLDAVDRAGGNTARFLYLQFLPRFSPSTPGAGIPPRSGRGGPGRGGPPPIGEGRGGLGPPLPPDTIQRIVKQLKGSVLTIRSPQDFARAVVRLNGP